MSRIYKIYGDYGYVTETLLHETPDLAEGKRWATKYAGCEDAGGFDVIEVAYFAEDGTYITEFVWQRDSA